MAKNISEEMFNKFKNMKSPSGWTFARAINTGVMHPSSFVGCHAGDLESYHMFKEFFYPVIEQYHVGIVVANNKLKTDLNPEHIGVQLTDLAKSKIISTRIRAARNLASHPLNPAGTRETRENIAKIAGEAFNKLPEDL
jgi:creatine kinase